MIYRIASSGLFNIMDSKLTVMQCAEKADLYEAFNYLAFENAQAKLQNETK